MSVLRSGFVVVVLLSAGIWSPVWAQKGKCQDVPTRWFIYPVATLADGTTTIASSIVGDGNWYSSSSGTSNTVIHVCGSDPTYDSTILLGNRRMISLSFNGPIDGSVIQESIAGSYQNSAFMNVRNLLCVGCTKAPLEPFTTRLAFQLYALVNRQDYRLRFMPHETDAPDRHTDPAGIGAENTPYETSPVLVLPQPYDCHTGGTVKPSWIVRGTMTTTDSSVPADQRLQVGTLYRVDRTLAIHAGQYSMPLEIRIEAITCFSY